MESNRSGPVWDVDIIIIIIIIESNWIIIICYDLYAGCLQLYTWNKPWF